MTISAGLDVDRLAPLAGTTLTHGRGPSRAVELAVEHLTRLGARAVCDGERDRGSLALEPVGVECEIVPVPEVVAQATTGLMAVHGRERGTPRRIGIDVSSIAAGVVAAQACLAALVGAERGVRAAGRITVSPSACGLLYLSHHIAMATCREPFRPPGALAPTAGSAPPFRTRDHVGVELETLRYESWQAFWTTLGVASHGLGEAWAVYAMRYLTADALLPHAFAAAIARASLAEVRSAGERAGVEIRRLRGADEPADEPPWTFTPRPTGRPLGGLDADSSPAAPLSGLRVVEAGTRLQGPLASLVLQMLGAEVIKVEPPGGDVGRAAKVPGLHAAYLAYNHGKRPVEIDIKSPAGRGELADLLAGADAFVHNWLPGRAERLGLDAESLAAVNPELVYAHASGWGSADATVGGDFVVQAHAGLGELISPDGEPPATSRVTLVDTMGGLVAAEGILAALLVRSRTALRVDTSLMGAAAVLRGSGTRAARSLAEPIPTRSGLLAVAPSDAAEAARLRAVCGLARGASDALLAERLGEGSASARVEQLTAAGLDAAVVRTELRSVAADPELADALHRLDTGTTVPTSPWRFER